MRVHIFGARGSIPTPGGEFVRYGGDTACIGFSTGDAPPTLLIDAGTGIRNMSRFLDQQAFQGSILLGHLHWDHVIGLPFFTAGDRPGSRVRVLMPAQGEARAVLEGLMSPPYFPIRCHDLLGDWTFEALEPGAHLVEGFSVLAREIRHRGGRTYGFRISDGDSTVAYLSDHDPIDPTAGAGGPHDDDVLELAAGADLLIHDAQYTAAEYEMKHRYGHASVEYAMGLAEVSGSRALLLFHHDPQRTDDQLDAIVAGHKGSAVATSAAVQDSVIDLTGSVEGVITQEAKVPTRIEEAGKPITGGTR